MIHEYFLYLMQMPTFAAVIYMLWAIKTKLNIEEYSI